MAFDTSFAKNVTSLIASLGTPVTVSRGGAVIFKTSAAFVAIKTTQDHSSPTSMLSRINNGECEAYIGAVKTVPLPGDSLFGKGRNYKVIEVEAYQPALITLGYKLKLQ